MLAHFQKIEWGNSLACQYIIRSIVAEDKPRNHFPRRHFNGEHMFEDNFSYGAVVFHFGEFLPLVDKYKAIVVETTVLEIVLQEQFHLHALVLHNACLDESRAQLLYVSRVMSAVIMKLLHHSIRVGGITVIFAFVRGQCFVVRVMKWHVAGTATDELCFLHGGLARFVPVGVAGVVKAHDVIEVEHVPTLVQHVNGKDNPYAVGQIFKRVEQPLLFRRDRLAVNEQQTLFRKIVLKLQNQVVVCYVM